MGGRTNARVDQSMSDTTCERAHILRQIINQDKSALTPEEGEGREGGPPLPSKCHPRVGAVVRSPQ